MQHLNKKQLSNLSVQQLDEIKHELQHAIGALKRSVRLNNSDSDYARMRTIEKYLISVKAVLQHKINTKQK